MRRKTYKTEMDKALLDAVFAAEREWKYKHRLVENSIDPLLESELEMKLAEAKYMFLLREAKVRKIRVIEY